MTAFFTASFTGKKYHLKQYLAIINHLKSKNIEVISDHIINTTESFVHTQNKTERLRFHAQLEKWLNECDFVVAESSFPSISVGYEIALALNLGKPILILYTEDGGAPSVLAHHKDEKVVCERYTMESFKGLIDDFVEFAEGKADTRFTFFLPHEFDAYIEKISRQRKVPKSVYLRRLIDEDMKKK
ncbi:hypothetical protein HY029_01420 [Candidatus Gottesmanbacteria bacterium]|nr:hypothetical protein [Candidatus Gottesmanbacteria bacterium]